MENYRLRGAEPPAVPPNPRLRGGEPPTSPTPNPRGVPNLGARWEGGDARPLAGPLGERERRVLVFERQWWRHAGAKEEAIRTEFGVGPTAYYQLLSRLLDDPAALAHDPMLVKRLQRQRASRRRRRASGRLTPNPSGGS